MKQRIVAAWKVLRGEWTAKPPEPTFTALWDAHGHSGTTVTSVGWTWVK